MKKLLTLFLLLTALTVTAQTDSVIYDSVQVYMINAPIHYGTDTVTSDSNYVWCYYHYIKKGESDYIYQPQFFIRDSLNRELTPNIDLMNTGWRSSGTVKEWHIDSVKAAQSPDSLRTFYVLPELKSIYGSSNVTKL